MKVYTDMSKKSVIRVMIFIAVCILLLGVSKAAGQGVEFKITQILQNETNPNVIAFVVSGKFQERDVVNIFSDNNFLKAKAVTAEIVGDSITIDNISTDLFAVGDNNIVAKLERSGVEINATKPFNLIIEEQLATPKVHIFEHEDGETLDIEIVGNFKKGHQIVVFLNDEEFDTKNISEEELVKNKVIITIQKEILSVGEHRFSAISRFGEIESDKSDDSSAIVIEEEIIEEIIEEEVIEDVFETIAGQCIEYSKEEKITLKNQIVQGFFGKNIAFDGRKFVTSTSDGATYEFTKENGKWTIENTIIVQDYANPGTTRTSLALNGDTLAVGRPTVRSKGYLSGAVDIYSFKKIAWIKTLTISPRDTKPYDSFGVDVALSENILVASLEGRNQKGSIYVYIRSNDSWAKSARFTPSDSAEEQNFGHSVSVDNISFAVGAPGDTGGSKTKARSGAVYVYTHSGTQWLSEKIAPNTLNLDDEFGTTVSIKGNLLFVGAPGDDTNGSNAGALYIYRKVGSFWQLEQKLVPEVESNPKGFGEAFSYDESGLLAVGAPGTGEKGSRYGAVYIFARTFFGWELQNTIIGRSGGSGSEFGSSVAIDGINLIVGASGNDTDERNAGAIYVIEGTMQECETDDTETEIKEFSIEDLTENKNKLEKFTTDVLQLIEKVQDNIKEIQHAITKKEERVVIFDEFSTTKTAQKRAAELRGIRAPYLPEEVVVKRIVINEPIPKEDQIIRTRDEVVTETRNDLGVVVPTNDRHLRLGDQDEEIYRLQVFLNENGYNIARDGPGSPGSETSNFGKATERALRSFQLVNGIPVTGVLDRKTRNIILTYVTDF